MLKLSSTNKATGTRILCPACRYPNLGIDIWCERCGGPMESSRAGVAPAAFVPETPEAPDPQPVAHVGNGSTASDWRPSMPAITLPKLAMAAMPQLSVPTLKWPRLSVPSIAWARFQMPAFAMPKLEFPRVSRLVLVVATVLAILLIAPLAYVLLPSIRPVAVRGTSGVRPATTTVAPAANSAQAVAIAGVKAKTGLPYAAASCPTSEPCLTVAGETLGQEAAAVLFSTAGSGGRQCVGYVFHSGASWHFLDAVCGLPGQLSPLVGRDATVHVPGNCANVRDQASLNGTVVACLHDGTTVKIDGGPNYADGRLWWHETHGWMAHDFLMGP
jgi:hypothetical protein